VTDVKVKETVASYYKRTWDEYVGPTYRSGAPAPGADPQRFARMLAAAQYLADHLHEAPVWIIACLEGVGVHGVPPTGPARRSIRRCRTCCWRRALGLGATLTTLFLRYEQEVAAALGLPEGVKSYALLAIGYPLGRFGPVRRIPLSEVVYRDRWGQPYAGAEGARNCGKTSPVKIATGSR
jgi:hypothetical protein